MRKPLVLAAGALVGLSTAACIVPGGPPPGSFTQLEREADSGINDIKRGAELVPQLPEAGRPGLNRLSGILLHHEENSDVDHWFVSVPGQTLLVECDEGTDPQVRVEIVPEDPDAPVTPLSCSQVGASETAFSESGRFFIYVYADDGGTGRDPYVLGVREAES